jgi:hypothetical protein
MRQRRRATIAGKVGDARKSVAAKAESLSLSLSLSLDFPGNARVEGWSSFGSDLTRQTFRIALSVEDVGSNKMAACRASGIQRGLNARESRRA